MTSSHANVAKTEKRIRIVIATRGEKKFLGITKSVLFQILCLFISKVRDASQFVYRWSKEQTVENDDVIRRRDGSRRSSEACDWSATDTTEYTKWYTDLLSVELLVPTRIYLI